MFRSKTLVSSAEAGTSVVGFALIAPVVVSVALLCFQIVGLVMCQVSIMAATKSAAHFAALAGSDQTETRRIAKQFFIPSGFADCGNQLKVSRQRENETYLVIVRQTQCLQIPYFERKILIEVHGSEIDEGKL